MKNKLLNIIKLISVSTVMVSGRFSGVRQKYGQFTKYVAPFFVATVTWPILSNNICNAIVERKKEEQNIGDQMRKLGMSMAFVARMTFFNEPITFENATQKLLGAHLMNQGYTIGQFSKNDKCSKFNGFNNVVGGAILFASRSSPALSCAVVSILYSDYLMTTTLDLHLKNVLHSLNSKRMQR